MTEDQSMEISSKIGWNGAGLVPAIAQEVGTGRVMMVAWMNREALELTVKERVVHYWSRSRSCLWKKGETSGNLQHVEDIRLDCDQDVVLVRVRVDGATACHTGSATCFFHSVGGDGEGGEGASPLDNEAVMGLLTRIIEGRKGCDPSESWTARLLDRGVDKIASKITEEAGELVDALAGESDERVVAESADLIYHVMVGLAARGLDIHAVSAELGRRFGVSGLQEKASR